MRSLHVLTVLTVALAVLTTACQNPASDTASTSVAVTGVTVNAPSSSLKVGSTLQLTATVSPANATNRSVVWKSDKTSVATVDAKGVVTAVSAGTATITVTTNEGSWKATFAVTVTVPVSSVTISWPSGAPNLTVTSGHGTWSPSGSVTLQLSATVAPDNATSPSVTWSCDATEHVSVSSTGLVTYDGTWVTGSTTGAAMGVVTITATAGAKSDTFTVSTFGAE